MEQLKKWDLISLASIPLIMTLGNSMLIPVLPLMKKQLGVSSFQISLIITVYAFVSILFIPLAGYLSDQIGRKKVIIPSLFLAGTGGLVAGLACWFFEQPYWWILAGRVIQGIGAAGAAPVVLPLVGDMFKREQDVSHGLGVIETANTVGKVLSPILGALLAGFVWFLPLLSIPVFCAASLLMVALLVKSPRKSDADKDLAVFLRGLKRIFKQKARWLSAVFAVGGICMFVLFGVLFYLSSFLEAKYHMEGVRKGFMLAIPLTALSVASYFTGRGIGQDKRRMKRVCFSGLVLLTASMFGGAFSTNIFLLLSVIFIGGIGIGLVLPCLDAFITEGIAKPQRGTVSALYSSMRFVGVSLGPPLVSILSEKSHLILFVTLSGVSAVGLILALFAIKPKQRAAARSPFSSNAFKAKDRQKA
ncbi:MFS transporter [Brevibacillus fulvus]|uniref:ACDE family multidrug resistance protein n=1 Tax=Brevibacillus fulvus TaxID=1125967 RepID=A0A939BNG4_9BACL|nr:MFS transporter [Brevibacillus fulvus]MBM7589005.1 ACDE family multidrug resistance protein [Brevibacillus fulvus]